MMKGLSVLALVLLVPVAVVGQGGVMEIDRQSVIFLYESRAIEPAPDEEIARQISMAYRRAKNEFERYELMEQLQPIIRERMEAAGAVGRVKVRVGVRLGEYDFERKAFPTPFGSNGHVPYADYALAFGNGEALSFLSVPLEAARSLASVLPGDRKVSFVLEGEIMAAERKTFAFLDREHGYVDIVYKALVVRVGSVVVDVEEGGRRILEMKID